MKTKVIFFINTILFAILSACFFILFLFSTINSAENQPYADNSAQLIVSYPSKSEAVTENSANVVNESDEPFEGIIFLG